MYRSLRLDGRDGGVHVLRDDVTSVQQAAGHVLASSRIALDHLHRRLEAGRGELHHRQLLVVSFLDGHNGRIGRQREVYSGVGHEVGLELGEVDVESTVEPQRRRDRRDDLADQPVEIRVGRPFDVEIAPTNVINRLVIHEKRAVRVLQGSVSRQDGIVRLHHGGGDLRRRVDSELQLRLLAVVHRQPVHQQTGEAGAGAAAERVEDEEALETAAHVGYLADPVEHKVNDFLAEGIMTARIIVRGVLFAGDQLLGVEQLMVGSCAYLV